MCGYLFIVCLLQSSRSSFESCKMYPMLHQHPCFWSLVQSLLWGVWLLVHAKMSHGQSAPRECYV